MNTGKTAVIEENPDYCSGEARKGGRSLKGNARAVMWASVGYRNAAGVRKEDCETHCTSGPMHNVIKGTQGFGT